MVRFGRGAIEIEALEEPFALVRLGNHSTVHVYRSRLEEHPVQPKMGERVAIAMGGTTKDLG